jgi:hypothetical protein
MLLNFPSLKCTRVFQLYVGFFISRSGASGDGQEWHGSMTHVHKNDTLAVLGRQARTQIRTASETREKTEQKGNAAREQGDRERETGRGRERGRGTGREGQGDREKAGRGRQQRGGRAPQRQQRGRRAAPSLSPSCLSDVFSLCSDVFSLWDRAQKVEKEGIK